jgi:tetratricopeptide (TPR) repeat protein
MKNSILTRIALLFVAVAVLAGCSPERKKARLLESAGKFYKAEEYEKAIIEYQNVLQLFPDDMVAMERLALIWLERGAPMRAARYLVKMKTAAPGNLELRLKLARLMLSMGKVGEARKEAALIVEKSSSFPDALILLTETIRSAADFKAVEETMEKMTDKSNVTYLVASANLMLLRGDGAAATTALQRAVARDPKSVAAQTALGGMYAAKGQVAQAREAYKTAADLSSIRSPARLKYAGYLALTGGVTEASEYLKDMSRKVPDYMPAWRGLVQIAMAQKKYDEALELLQTLFKQDQSDYEGRILRARIAMAKGETKQAIEEFEKLGKDFPGLGLEKHQLALAHVQNNDHPNAIAALQEAISANQDNVEAVLLFAQLSLRAGNAQAAAAAASELVTRHPDMMQAYGVLLDAMRALGKLDNAARVLSQNLQRAPKNPQLHYLLGMIYEQQQKWAEARDSFEKSLELAPDSIVVIAELIGLDLFEKKVPAATTRVQALLEKHPKLAAAHFLEARVHANTRAWDKAETALLKTLELDPRFAGAHGALAECFAARKDQPGTIARLQEFVAKRPNDDFAVIVAGQFYTQINEPQKAREAYEKYLVTKPDAGVVLNNLANLYADQLKQPDRALELARKARAAEPTSPLIADTLGWILYHKKAYDEALPLLQESGAKFPQHPEIHYHLGMVNRALGNNDAALASLRIATNTVATYTGKDDAARELQALEKIMPAAISPVTATPEPAPIAPKVN